MADKLVCMLALMCVFLRWILPASPVSRRKASVCDPEGNSAAGRHRETVAVYHVVMHRRSTASRRSRTESSGMAGACTSINRRMW